MQIFIINLTFILLSFVCVAQHATVVPISEKGMMVDILERTESFIKVRDVYSKDRTPYELFIRNLEMIVHPDGTIERLCDDCCDCPSPKVEPPSGSTQVHHVLRLVHHEKSKKVHTFISGRKIRYKTIRDEEVQRGRIDSISDSILHIGDRDVSLSDLILIKGVPEHKNSQRIWGGSIDFRSLCFFLRYSSAYFFKKRIPNPRKMEAPHRHPCPNFSLG